MTDMKNVQEYELTVGQKNRIAKLMKEFGYGNVEVFMDLMIGHEYFGLDRIRRERQVSESEN